MALSLASSANIPLSDAKKSVHFTSSFSPSSLPSDPRFDFVNFPNPSRLNRTLSYSSLATSNRFSALANFSPNSDSYSPSPRSFASIVNPSQKFSNLRTNSLPRVAISKGSSPADKSHSDAPHVSDPRLDYLNYSNGRSPFTYCNGAFFTDSTIHFQFSLSC